MSTNHTPNYQLSQWEATDKVLRTDFNADNAKIDTALSSLDTSLSSLSTALAGKLGRGQTIQTYYPTTSGHTCGINFPGINWSDWEYVCVLVKYQDDLDQTTPLSLELWSINTVRFKVDSLAMPGYLVVFLPWHDGKKPAAGFILSNRFIPFSLSFPFEKLNHVNAAPTTDSSLPYPKFHFFGGK